MFFIGRRDGIIEYWQQECTEPFENDYKCGKYAGSIRSPEIKVGASDARTVITVSIILVRANT
jgi:hypothetical protein